MLNYASKFSAQERVLCLAISCHPSTPLAPLIAPLKKEELWQFAENNEVSSHLAHALMREVSAEAVSESWSHFHSSVEKQLSGYLKELDRVAEIFSQEGIILVALKNAGIARGIYRCLGCSPMGDLDLLVDRKDFRRAHAILLREGFQFKFRSKLEKDDLEEAERGGGTEYWKILPDGNKLWLELQWRPVAGRWIQPHQEPKSAELIATSIPIEGTKIRLLAPEDNLLQVALHTAKHTYIRAPGFRLHTDVDRIVNAYQIDWKSFVQKVKHLKVATVVYFSLAIPQNILNTPIPDWVLAELSPPAWKEKWMGFWIYRAGLFNPQDKKFSRLGYVVFTMLMFDSFGDLWRGIFPASSEMKTKYQFQNSFLLPFYHLKRLSDLFLRRNKT